MGVELGAEAEYVRGLGFGFVVELVEGVVPGGQRFVGGRVEEGAVFG